MLAIILLPLLTYAQVALPWQSSIVQDDAAYDKAKTEWIAKNPQAYERLNAGGKLSISQAEFLTMPAEKQAHIMANLDKYELTNNALANPTTTNVTENGVKMTISQSEFATMPAEKQAHIMANLDKYALGSEPTQNATSPKTFLSRKEVQSLSAEKKEYISQHPELYTITD